MKYGFLDEAGDVGYAGSSSTYLLIVIVVVRQPELLRKAVARTADLWVNDSATSQS